MRNYLIYSDGAYSPSTNKGGIGFVILRNNKEIFSYSKMFKNTTNQRMEVLAMCVALESLKYPSRVKIVTDSMYLVGTLTKGWRRKANLDLWSRLDDAIAKHENVEVEWCKGHAGSVYNEKADKLAYNASKEIG